MKVATGLHRFRARALRARPSSAEERSVGNSLGLAAAMMTTAWFLAGPLYHVPRPSLAWSIAVFGYGILAVGIVRSRRFSARMAIQLIAIAVLCALCLASVDQLGTMLATRVPSLDLLARTVPPLLNLEHYPATSAHGALHVMHPEGLITVLPSFEKLGIVSLIQLLCLWLMLQFVLDGRRMLDHAAAGAVVLLLIAIVRFAACLLLYLECDDIMDARKGLEALSLFSGPVATGVTLLLAGLMLNRVRHLLLARAPAPPRCAPSVRVVAAYFSAFVGMGALIAFAASYDPPGRAKLGRVLFDDRFCGVWEPTARQLDTEWYGDFSTYSFSSFAEWLGHWFIVDVNCDGIYTDELLSRFDVLVLKTPVVPIPEVERMAIDRFVNAGGGLLLVGDHTNLLGMGTHLNSLCSKYGLRFRYDSVSDAATGGFVNYFGSAWNRSVGALSVDHLQLMTSCSLELGSHAEPIVVAPACRRDPHDYAASSFFGRSGPHPELSHGPAILAAWARAGRGRIAAFTDSTVWSSFAFFQFDRDKLAADMVGLLNREPSGLKLPIRCIALAAALVAMLMGRMCLRSGAALSMCLGGFVGLWVGMLISFQAHRALYDLGPPRAPLHEVCFLWKGGSCAFPAVLGGTGSLPLDRAFDTLLTSTQRLGLVPRVAYTYEELLTDNTRALFIIAPVDPPAEPIMKRVEAFVRQGGALIIMDDGRLQGSGSAPTYLHRFGIDLQYRQIAGPDGKPTVHSALNGLVQIQSVPDTGTFVGHRAVGKGHIVYLRDAASFSRVGMGHCFARPGKQARARYDTVFWLLRDLLHIAGDGDRRFYGISL